MPGRDDIQRQSSQLCIELHQSYRIFFGSQDDFRVAGHTFKFIPDLTKIIDAENMMIRILQHLVTAALLFQQAFQRTGIRNTGYQQYFCSVPGMGWSAINDVIRLPILQGREKDLLFR